MADLPRTHIMKPFTNKIISIDNTLNKKVTYAKLLQQFPKIKFSYELKSYKKVSTYSTNINDESKCEENSESVYFIIPKGKKYFVWFKNSECLFLELDNDKQIVNVTCKKPSRIFPNDTLLYGTQFYYRMHTNSNSNSVTNVQYYFTIENVHYYNGVNLDATQTAFEKLKTLHLAFTTVMLEKTFQVDIGLPHINTCLDRISAVKPFYQIYCIQKRKASDIKNQYENIHLNMLQATRPVADPAPTPTSTHQHTVVTFSKMITTAEPAKKNVEKTNGYIHIHGYNNKYKIFIVSPDIQNDIYYLIDPDSSTTNDNNDNNDNNDVVPISNKLIASIPDYKTSVMMNALFRNIKENRSLDALEESDDEDEFENTNIDKFVNLNKKIKMKCVFNYKFKKWTPIECVE